MSADTDTNSVVIKPPAVSALVREELLGLAPRLGRDLGENLLDAILVDLLERVGAIVRRHLRDELGGLARRDRLEELGSQLLVEILEDVGGASGPERREKCLQLSRSSSSATPARSAGWTSSVSTGMSAGDSSSSAMMSGASRVATGRSSGFRCDGVMGPS